MLTGSIASTILFYLILFLNNIFEQNTISGKNTLLDWKLCGQTDFVSPERKTEFDLQFKQWRQAYQNILRP